MGKVIQISQYRAAQHKEIPQESNAYRNLLLLMQTTVNMKTLNFYIESIETLEKSKYLLNGEASALREMGRAKRLKLAKPDPIEVPVATEPGLYNYTPEMGGQKPDCQMEASRGYYGGHWYIDTPLEIKGRGIKFVKQYKASDFTNREQNHRCGWNEYCVTDRAFESLKEKYTISKENLLD